MSENKTSPQLWAVVTIAVAVIACLGTITSAIIAKVPISTLPAFTSTPILVVVTTTPVPTYTNFAPTESLVLPPTASSEIYLSPSPTKIPISDLNRLAILTWLGIPRQTRIDIDRLDVVYRQNRSSFLVTIPDYPLLPQYTMDDYGYLFEHGIPFNYPIGNNVGELLNIDSGTWKNYLGVFDFVIPVKTDLQSCGFFIRSSQGGVNWESSQRFIYSGDITSEIKIERASWVDIKDCYDYPFDGWAKRNAQNAAASSTTDSVYYWDKSSNTWVQLK